MNRKLCAIALLLATTACSKAEDQAYTDQASVEVKEEAQPADRMAVPPAVRVQPQAEASSAPMAGPAPGIDSTVAPGVAFNYRYDFSLPEPAISAVQEQHAQACAKLGVDHCQVTGITFKKERNGDLEAQMSFKLDPAMALGFSRNAAELVTKSDGVLESSDVTGNNAGEQIVEGDKSVVAKRSELSRIEAEMKIPGLGQERRNDLAQQASQLRSEIASLVAGRDAKVASLATTPVLFTYAPNEAIMGFDRNSPVQQGLSLGKTSFSGMFSFLAIVLGVLTPWSLVGLGIWWIVRRLRAKRAAAVAE